MADWISLDTLSRTDDGGKTATLSIAETAKVLIESSPSHRDVRVEIDEHIVAIRLTSGYQLERILVDDVPVWSPSDG